MSRFNNCIAELNKPKHKKIILPLKQIGEASKHDEEDEVHCIFDVNKAIYG